MPKLQIIGQLLVEPDGWEVVSDNPDAIFVAYNREPPETLPLSVKVIGTNMSRPDWYRVGYHQVTTRDIPRDILASVTPTAEHAIGMMMALHRNLIPASQQPLADRSEFLAPRMLSTMRAVVMGYGRIGRMVYDRTLRLFHAVTAYDPTMCSVGSLEYLISAADVVFLCCPASPFGHPMGTAEFAQMPKDAIIVNIAQPDLLDWDAALAALLQDRLRGVAADVFPEWVPSDYLARPLTEEGKLLLTPHIAGSTLDARKITEKAVLDVMRSKLDA